jgi:hypothetical protein
VVIAVRTYLEQRKKAQAATLQRVRERYDRPGARQRVLKILEPGLSARSSGIRASQEAGVAAEGAHMSASPDRRTMLRGLGVLTAGAAATVAAIPAIAATETPDPVFAVIEALTNATAHLDDLRDTGDHLAYEEACRTERAAFDALISGPNLAANRARR